MNKSSWLIKPILLIVFFAIVSVIIFLFRNDGFDKYRGNIANLKKNYSARTEQFPLRAEADGEFLCLIDEIHNNVSEPFVNNVIVKSYIVCEYLDVDQNSVKVKIPIILEDYENDKTSTFTFATGYAKDFQFETQNAYKITVDEFYRIEVGGYALVGVGLLPESSLSENFYVFQKKLTDSLYSSSDMAEFQATGNPNALNYKSSNEFIMPIRFSGPIDETN